MGSPQPYAMPLPSAVISPTAFLPLPLQRQKGEPREAGSPEEPEFPSCPEPLSLILLPAQSACGVRQTFLLSFPSKLKKSYEANSRLRLYPGISLSLRQTTHYCLLWELVHVLDLGTLPVMGIV